jgi:O-antigen/teichoic acid export membrane protein
MKEKIRSLFRYNFVKDTAILQAGTFISTGLSFAASVVFARVLGPEDYGIYALIFAFVGLIEIFMNWGADYATITLLAEAWARRDKEEIKNIIVFFVKTSLIISFTIGLLAILLAPILAEKIYHQHFQVGLLARWIIAAGLIRFVFFLSTIILQVSRKIKYLTTLENINKIIYIIIPVGLVFLGLGIYGIVIGHLISALIFFIFSFYLYQKLLKRTELLPNLKEIWRELKTVSIKKYFKFGFLIAINKNLANLYSILPITFLGMLMTGTQISYFKIAFSYIGLSLMFLGPISRLLMVQLPRSKVQGHQVLKEHFFKTAFYSFLIICVIIIPMVFLSKYLVVFFYGANYLPTVKLIYLLWPYALIAAWGIGLGALYRTINKMKAAIIIDTVNLVIGAPIFYWLIKQYDLIGMAITTIAWLGITTLVSWIYLNRYFKKISLKNN